MPTEDLLPAQIIPGVAETHRSHISKKSQLIYAAVLILLLAAGASLPFIAVTVNVKSAAFIRPATEVTVVRSLVSGRVLNTAIHENQFVKKGDVLIVVESDVLYEKEKLLSARIEDTRQFILDLQTLTDNSSDRPALATLLYQQTWNNYRQQMADAATRLNKAQTGYNRNFKLHKEKVIADVEFELYQFELNKAISELDLLKQNRLSQWQGELRTYEKEMQELEGQLALLQREKENLVIKASVSGTIQNLSGIYAGSLVFANQELAQLSPDTSLIAEAYVKPNDIGLVQASMPARFQVDAFNYNQWGLATGKVIEISHDVHMVNNQPVFKIRCSLDQDYLQLKNGYKGFLRKGMTLQARFMVTERTLWQLLYDKIDDWLNPNTFVN